MTPGQLNAMLANLKHIQLKFRRSCGACCICGSARAFNWRATQIILQK